MATAFLAYLDPGNNDPAVWEWVVLAALVVAVVLLAVYALTRFVAWAARR